jgi:hypothetical protein
MTEQKKTRKPYKTITDPESNSEIRIFGNHHFIEIEYQIPEWNEENEDQENSYEECFKYKGDYYFLSEFMNIHNKVYNPNPAEWMKEFSGIKGDSYFSGLLIKLNETGEAVQVYYYSC